MTTNHLDRLEAPNGVVRRVRRAFAAIPGRHSVHTGGPGTSECDPEGRYRVATPNTPRMADMGRPGPQSRPRSHTGDVDRLSENGLSFEAASPDRYECEEFRGFYMGVVAERARGPKPLVRDQIVGHARFRGLNAWQAAIVESTEIKRSGGPSPDERDFTVRWQPASGLATVAGETGDLTPMIRTALAALALAAPLSAAEAQQSARSADADPTFVEPTNAAHRHCSGSCLKTGALQWFCRPDQTCSLD